MSPLDYCAIDFGTSNSAIALPSESGIRLVELVLSKPTASRYGYLGQLNIFHFQFSSLQNHAAPVSCRFSRAYCFPPPLHFDTGDHEEPFNFPELP